MVAKTMDENEFCDNCMQKHDCQSIYRQMGDVKGPSVVIKVIVAFLLPLVVFIVSLAIFERILGGAISTDQFQTALSLPAALLITFICILIVRLVNRRIGQVG